MVKYYCDRCGKRVYDLTELCYIGAQWGWDVQICPDCKEFIKADCAKAFKAEREEENADN